MSLESIEASLRTEPIYAGAKSAKLCFQRDCLMHWWPGSCYSKVCVFLSWGRPLGCAVLWHSLIKPLKLIAVKKMLFYFGFWSLVFEFPLLVFFFFFLVLCRKSREPNFFSSDPLSIMWDTKC